MADGNQTSEIWKRMLTADSEIAGQKCFYVGTKYSQAKSHSNNISLTFLRTILNAEQFM